MKHKLFFIIPYLLLVFLLSCEKDDDNSLPECDVNGVWLGEWESNKQINGTFCANVTQNLTDFSGKIIIRFDKPATGYYNRNFDGTVKSKNVRTVMTIKGVEIAAEGNITDDTSVSGDFNVPDLSMYGTFNGKKTPTTEAKLTEIYSSSGNQERILDFVYIDNSLWLFTYPEWIDEEYKNKVYKYDINGNLNETIHYQREFYNRIASDGQYIWSIGNWSIFKYDTNGNKLDSLVIPESFTGHNIACNSSNLFFFIEGKIYKTDHLLNIKDSINPRYNIPAAYTVYKDYQLYSSGNVLYKMNKTGEIIHAYIFPNERIVYEIETNGDKVWCLVNLFDIDSGNESYTVYEVNLN